MLFETCTKLTFGLSDRLVITVIARNRINSVGSLFFRDRIRRFGKNMPSSLKRFLSNFNAVAIKNSPNEKEPATGFAVISYFLGVREPIEKFE